MNCNIRLLLSVLITALHLFIGCSRVEEKPQWGEGVRRFGSCQELNGEVENRLQRAVAFRKTLSPKPEGDVVVNSVPGGSVAYNVNQEPGVGEPDYVVSSATQIFFSRPGRVEVVDAQKLRHLGAITLQTNTEPKLFLNGNRLVVIENPNGSPNASLKVSLYTVSPAAMPEEVFKKAFSGRYLEARRKGNRLLLVLNFSSLSNVIVPKQEKTAQEIISLVREAGISCEEISAPLVPDLDFRITRFISVSTDAPFTEKAVSVLGGGDVLYMSPSNLYVVKSQMYWPYAYASHNSDSRKSGILKVAFDENTGDLYVKSAGVVEGLVKDRWALKEIPTEETLAVATTLYESWQPSSNMLTILSEEQGLRRRRANVSGFGRKEDIRAVRYIGDMAYVVTFKKTDPLYAIDLSRPLSPKILGELKVPGFSTLLQPIAKDRLVGIGFEAKEMGDFALYQGIQVSLFDTKDPLDLKRLDNKTHGERGSFSDVTHDFHALTLLTENSSFVLPVVELEGAEDDGGSAIDLVFSGAIIYGHGNKLEEKGRLTHQQYLPKKCLTRLREWAFWSEKKRSADIHRTLVRGQNLIAISKAAMTVHDLMVPSRQVEQLLFPAMAPNVLCPRYPAW